MEQQFTKRQYSASQTTLLTKSMLLASLAFIILGACSYGWSVLFVNSLDYDNMGIGLGIFFATLISGMVISILWVKNMFQSQSIALTLLCYGLYILTTSLAFGWLFSLAANFMKLWWLPVMFGITGGIFLMAILFSKILSFNSVLTMGKVIGATALSMAVALIIFMVLAIVTSATRSEGTAIAANTIGSLIMIGMAVISFLYVIIDIWQISKMSEFNDEAGVQSKILPWFFGYRLLTDLVNILFIVFIFILRFARRR